MFAEKSEMLKTARLANFNLSVRARSHRGVWSSIMSHAKTRRTRKRFTKSGRPIEVRPYAIKLRLYDFNMVLRIEIDYYY